MCWGKGKKETTANDDQGQSLPPTGAFKALALGGQFTCGLRVSGQIACWGRTYIDGKSVTMPAPVGSFTSVVVGAWFACGRKTSGQIVCWGGLTQTISPAVPAIKYTGSNYTKLASSSFNTCALQDGQVRCQGALIYRGHLPAMPAPTGKFQHIYGGGQSRMCAHRVDGSLVCWGDYEKGGFYTP